MLNKAHAEGHYGEHVMITKLYKDLKVWWPRIRDDVHKICSTCVECQRHNVLKRGFHPMASTLTALPHDLWEIDLVKMDESEDGNNWILVILVIIDLFSSFIIARALKNKTAQEVGKHLYKVMCTSYAP